MFYCIFHLGPSNGRRFDFGVTKDFVERIVIAYLKGEREITYRGRDYFVGSEALQIYEVTSDLGDSEQIQRYFNQISYMHEGELAKYCRNVTNDFLLDRIWGELKEDYFNVYVNDGDKKPIIAVLTKGEVEDFHSALSAGTTPIFVSGRLLHFKQPKTIKIFNISFEFLSKNRSDIKERIKNWVNKNNQGKWNTKILEHFGKDVTTDFNIKPFSIKNSIEIKETKQHSSAGSKIDSERKIFISHSSKDVEIVTSFTNNILKLGFDVNKNKIFCTSIEGGKIKTGQDFRKIISEEMDNAKAVIQIISENYKRSEVCLNEMGAAWASDKIVIPLIVPPMKYDIGFIHQTSQQLQIGNRKDIVKLYDDFKSDLFAENISIANLDKCIELFIDDLQTALARQNANGNDTDVFYDENVELVGVLNEGIFSGPPWGEEDPEKVSHHRFYFLKLDNPINILTSDISEDGSENSNKFGVSEIQLMYEDTQKLRKQGGKAIKVFGQLNGAFTAWHRKPVFLICTEVSFI